MSEELAAVSIRKFVKMFQGLSELDPALTDLASVKQAKLEAESRLNQVLATEAKAVDELKQRREEIAQAKAEAAALKEQAQAEYNAKVREAVAEGIERIAEAKREIEQIRSSSSEELKSINTEAADASANLAMIRSELDDAKRRYVETQEKIDTLVKKLGGK